MIYILMLFPRTKLNHLNNDQDEQEVIKHCDSKAYKTENVPNSPPKNTKHQWFYLMCPISRTSFIYLISNNFSQRLSREEGACFQSLNSVFVAFGWLHVGCTRWTIPSFHSLFVFRDVWRACKHTYTPRLSSVIAHTWNIQAAQSQSVRMHAHTQRPSVLMSEVSRLSWVRGSRRYPSSCIC